MNRENAWTTYEEADIKALEGLCKEYKDFLSNGKTERECVAQSIELAKKAGYQDLEELIKNQTPLKAGNKVYRTWMEKTIALFQIGEDAIEDGLNILGAHIDSPRLDLKQNPLYEDTEMAKKKKQSRNSCYSYSMKNMESRKKISYPQRSKSYQLEKQETLD